ncbi:hypothetical protein JY651_02720 [Pyxidicoccus parkwayensis]|uniref:Outer membrane protein beta-barrel domain-containing protein n=1 Tax=Pyxidicoccus parkwayensis TaxID=2813578 RepID=A0ABX7NZS9_9BACT|nr:hypothetical protein [Pyxidicoccus parkwaysis]QSQ23916.1 hypothetical protein JY651_02720 [Pyxidicoccus parkwaysis]
MKRLVPGVLLACFLALPGTALAQRGQGWSLLAADTLGRGNTAFSAQIGWPGLTLGLLHGGSERFDIGGKFTFNWGREGWVRFTDPGIKLQAWMRLLLAQKGNISLALTFQPGPLFYFPEGDTDVGLALPVALVVGIPAGSAVMVNLGLDMPFHVYFGEGIGPVFPILVGGGLEYFIDRSLAVNFNIRMGPSLIPDFEATEFTLEALVGVGYRF